MNDANCVAENVRRYDYLISRVEYPREHGYRMEPEKLPDWIHFTITETDDSKYVTVHSRIHLNKAVVMNPVYSNAFTDEEIIKDMSGKISSAFL